MRFWFSQIAKRPMRGSEFWILTRFLCVFWKRHKILDTLWVPLLWGKLPWGGRLRSWFYRITKNPQLHFDYTLFPRCSHTPLSPTGSANFASTRRSICDNLNFNGTNGSEKEQIFYEDVNEDHFICERRKNVRWHSGCLLANTSWRPAIKAMISIATLTPFINDGRRAIAAVWGESIRGLDNIPIRWTVFWRLVPSLMFKSSVDGSLHNIEHAPHISYLNSQLVKPIWMFSSPFGSLQRVLASMQTSARMSLHSLPSLRRLLMQNHVSERCVVCISVSVHVVIGIALVKQFQVVMNFWFDVVGAVEQDSTFMFGLIIHVFCLGCSLPLTLCWWNWSVSSMNTLTSRNKIGPRFKFVDFSFEVMMNKRRGTSNCQRFGESICHTFID